MKNKMNKIHFSNNAQKSSQNFSIKPGLARIREKLSIPAAWTGIRPGQFVKDDRRARMPPPHQVMGPGATEKASAPRCRKNSRRRTRLSAHLGT